MEPLHPIGRLFNWIVSAAKGLSGKLAREKPVDPPPAMIGLPPSARGLNPIPENIDEHLVDFCTRYWEPSVEIAKKRMREVGVPEERIGMLDVDNDYRLAVFHPKQLDGGGVHPPTGRINLDAGLFKPGLLAEAMSADVSSLHEAARASVRQDAIIAHEFEQGIRGSHEAALEHAPETGLSIKEEARRLLRAQRDRSL
ncbi:MAG: hypothetical protein WA746_31000 [Isosphaeraceae bacterium]